MMNRVCQLILIWTKKTIQELCNALVLHLGLPVCQDTLWGLEDGSPLCEGFVPRTLRVSTAPLKSPPPPPLQSHYLAQKAKEMLGAEENFFFRLYWHCCSFSSSSLCVRSATTPLWKHRTSPPPPVSIPPPGGGTITDWFGKKMQQCHIAQDCIIVRARC